MKSNFAQYIKSNRNQCGMSLLEILIAMTIGLFILGGILVVYVQSNQSFRMSESTSRLQESARFAFDLLSRDIRGAGYMGCFGDVGSVNIIAASPPTFTTGTVLQGTDAATASASMGITTAIANTDLIRIRRASVNGVGLTGNMATVNANVQIGKNPYEFQANDFLFISDCVSADIFCATNVSSAGGKVTIAHASCNTSNNLSKTYGTDAMVMAFEENVFYIANNPAGQPALYRRPWNGNAAGTAVEQVEGVEDMQLCYGEDTNGNRSVNVYRQAANVVDWADVLSVRVSLLVRTTEAGIAANAQAYAIDKNCDGDTADANESVTPTDRRIRRVFQSTIGLRNRLP